MKWRGRRQSSNVEDQRGSGGGGGGFGGIRFPMGTGRLSGLQGPPTGGPVTQQAPRKPGADPLRDFVAVVLADTEDAWHGLFKTNFNQAYREPKLVLFSGGVRSACGYAGSAVGPFYCPGDQKVYLDLNFFRQLKDRFKAPGDFAQAYVIAQEVGHHVQTLLGISKKVHEARSRLPKAKANALSVRQELQADCFAGVWANHADRAKKSPLARHHHLW